MTTITKDLLRALQIDIDAALTAVAKKHKVALKLGRATFTDTNATFKLLVAGGEAKASDDAASVLDAENYRKYAKSVGMKLSWLNKKFIFDGKTYVLLGYKPERSRFNVVIQQVNSNKKVLLTTYSVCKAFAR